MSELTNTFTDIADAIREKTGKSALMTPSNMANEVRSISGGGEETSDSTPIGTIHPFAGSSIPEGFLACDGSAVSRTTYSDLFDVIGTTWGSGDGSTTFNVPDLREVAPVGIGQSERTEGAHDEFTLGEFKDDQLQSHTHSYTAAANSSGQVGVGSYPIGNGSGSHYTFSTNRINTGRSGNVTRGKRIGVNYIIKYQMVEAHLVSSTNEADAYDPTSTYVKGNNVIYNGNYYECNTDISTPEAWDTTHWTQKKIGNQISQINTDLSALSTYDELYLNASVTSTRTITVSDMSNYRYIGVAVAFDANSLNNLVMIPYNLFKVKKTESRSTGGSGTAYAGAQYISDTSISVYSSLGGIAVYGIK